MTDQAYSEHTTGHRYHLRLTEGEIDSLSWVAARYDSADTLIQALEAEDDAGHFTISEADAWGYLEALAAEDGDCMVPPCIGGDLATKLIDFATAIV